MMDPQGVCIRIEDLTAGYGKRIVLQNISTVLKPGVVTALIGPNGSGKSTLIKAISGTIPMIRGKVRMNGTDLLTLGPERRSRFLAVVPQARNLPGAFTVEEVVLMGRTPYAGWMGQFQTHDLEALFWALKVTETETLAERRLGELSGGEQQRVLIARALAQEAPFVLLDEATAHLDLHHQLSVIELVGRLAREQNLSILMAMHDLNTVLRIADEVILLDQGKVIAQGDPGEVMRPDLLEAVYQVSLQSATTSDGTILLNPRLP